MADTMSKRVLRIVLGDRAIAYHPYLARVMQSVAGGVWLSQILYWDSVKASMSDDNENWFYKTDAEIIGETCLSRREARTAKDYARKIGIVKTELRGMPAKTHYLVDVDALESAIGSLYNGGKLVSTMGVKQDGTKSLVKLTPEYTESTQESTQESTGASKNDAPPTPESPKASTHPAIVIYREVKRAYPRKELYPMIIEQVGDSQTALDLWRFVLIGWSAVGWNPMNVSGMLEFFRRGEIPKTNGNGNGNKNKMLPEDRGVKTRMSDMLALMRNKGVLE